ncbi:VPS50 protein, partial [Polypterus senegalus]
MIMKLEFEGVMMNVVNAYAQQVGCAMDEKEDFWSELDNVIDSVPKGQRVVIGADFNGHEELREMREQPIDPQAEQEIINSIDEVYFSNDSFDVVNYELEKLPTVLNLEEIEEYRDKLKKQQAAVRNILFKAHSQKTP